MTGNVLEGLRGTGRDAAGPAGNTRLPSDGEGPTGLASCKHR